MLIRIIRNTLTYGPIDLIILDNSAQDTYLSQIRTNDFINWADIPHNIVDIGNDSDNVIKSTYRGCDIFELESLPTTDKIYIYYMKEIIIKSGIPCNKITAYMQSDNMKYTYYTDSTNEALENLYKIGSYKTADEYESYIHFTPECPTTDYHIDVYCEIVYPEEDIIGSRFEVCIQEYEYELLE